jgi:hypothetical protein
VFETSNSQSPTDEGAPVVCGAITCEKTPPQIACRHRWTAVVEGSWGADMKARWCVLLLVAMTVVVTSCGDDGPDLLTHDKGTLVLFKRVTLAADSPGRAEIEIEVRAGADFSLPAPDGTRVWVETSLGQFEGGGPRVDTSTVGGRAVVTLILPGAAHLHVTASTEDVEARLAIVVNADGSVQVGPT